MTYKAKAAVCSQIGTKHSTQSEHHVEFLNVNLVVRKETARLLEVNSSGCRACRSVVGNSASRHGVPKRLSEYRFCEVNYRGADKSLARPGRKQATATKWVLQVTQKKFRKLSVQPGPSGSNDLCVGRKVATFQLFFQSGRTKDLSAPLHYFQQNSYFTWKSVRSHIS